MSYFVARGLVVADLGFAGLVAEVLVEEALSVAIFVDAALEEVLLCAEVDLVPIEMD